MSLFKLPPELLVHIFDYVGSSYFRSDLSRLTVCKEWSLFAHTACYSKVDATQKTLRRLLSSPYTESSLVLLKNSVETMNVCLQGFEDCDSVPENCFGSDPRRDEGICIDTYIDAIRAAWTVELNNDLIHLATILKQSPKLRVLRIHTLIEVPSKFTICSPRQYSFCTGIDAFLSASNLTSLELDLCGSGLQHWDQENGDGLHMCTSIAALLTTLRRLRLRMRDICTETLKPPRHSTDLRLSEVLVNLSLSGGSSFFSSVSYARRCGCRTEVTLALKGEMERQAQDLVAQMAAPKIVRVLTQYPTLRLQAFDVLAGKSVYLAEGAKWDDDGEVIEDELLDVEPEISSIASF